jgi:hypothetical protein
MAARADEAPCTGDACAVIKVSDDGCAWTNAGKRAVRFSLIAKDEARMATVLGPGEAFKETDKAFCVVKGKNDPRYDARFAVLAVIPDEEAAAKAPPMPRNKPMISVAQVETAIPAVAMPRAKPAAPPAAPAPRPKPVEAAATPATPAAAATAAAPGTTLPPAACGEACPPILFKTYDDCLWVLNFNPRPVAFQAVADGKRFTLALEAADGEKADAQARDAKPAHMRFRDPFQSAGSGLPFYRAQLGAGGACVKNREEISTFVADYAN